MAPGERLAPASTWTLIKTRGVPVSPKYLLMDETTSRVRVEWTAHVVYSSTFNMTPVQAVWVYVGLTERRQHPRTTSGGPLLISPLPRRLTGQRR